MNLPAPQTKSASEANRSLRFFLGFLRYLYQRAVRPIK